MAMLAMLKKVSGRCKNPFKKKTHQTQHLQDPQDVAHLSVRDLMLLDMKARIQGIELEPESNVMGIYRYLWIFMGFIYWV